MHIKPPRTPDREVWTFEIASFVSFSWYKLRKNGILILSSPWFMLYLCRTVLNDGDESSFDLSRPSSPWLCKNDCPAVCKRVLRVWWTKKSIYHSLTKLEWSIGQSHTEIVLHEWVKKDKYHELHCTCKYNQ